MGEIERKGRRDDRGVGGRGGEEVYLSMEWRLREYSRDWRC